MGLCCSLLEIDSWYQRAEVSPLNKMKSMSQAHGDDRKIYQSPGKINIWAEDAWQERPPEGLSLHRLRKVDGRGLVGWPAGLGGEGCPDRQMLRTSRTREEWNERHHSVEAGRQQETWGSVPALLLFVLMLGLSFPIQRARAFSMLVPCKTLATQGGSEESACRKKVLSQSWGSRWKLLPSPFTRDSEK